MHRNMDGFQIRYLEQNTALQICTDDRLQNAYFPWMFGLKNMKQD